MIRPFACQVIIFFLTTYSCYAIDNYIVYSTGSMEDVSTLSEPGVIFMGGGTDTDEAFEWQIKAANGGDFLIIRASGSDGYNVNILC